MEQNNCWLPPLNPFDFENDCLNFWKNKWLPLLISWLVWIVIYECFNAWYNESGINIKHLIKCKYSVT